MSATSREREEVCRVGQSLFDRGYVHGSAGNISLRLVDGATLITPTDACLGTLDPAALAVVDSQGQELSGERASKTLALHRRIYTVGQAQADVAGAAVHIAAVKQRLANAAYFVALARGGAHKTSNAWVKKSSPPKLPDFKAK